jgi:aminopeptidase N
MRWWDDLWLNEGFASWMESRPLAAKYPEWNIEVDEAIDTQAALTLDGLRATRPIHSNAETPAEIEETFDAIAYQKGAAVLRMVERYVGADDFRAGINAYLARHAYGNATSEDFWRAIAATSKKPVDRILPTFVNQPGVPLLDVTVSCAGGAARVTVKQQRFVIDPADNAANAGARWNIPVCRTSSAAPDASCTELRDAAADLSEAACPAWVFLNAGARGYYRTAYPPSMLAALSSDLATKLTASERLSLAGDEWALVRAGRHSVADYLTLASGFGAEQSSGVLDEVVTRLAFIHDYLASEEQRPRVQQFVRSLLRPLFNQIGLMPRPGESDEARALRAVVVDGLGRSGNDAEVLSATRAYVDRALAGEAPLDPTIASTALRLAARRGDRALFDGLVAAAQKAGTPEEHYRYVNAVSSFEDPALVQLGLERLLKDEIRTQDAEGYLRGFLSNPNASVNRLAWSFVKQHAAAVLPKVSISFGDARMVGSLVSFCDAGMRDDIKDFFTRNARPAAARALEQTVERINNCIELKGRQERVLSDWLDRAVPR